MEYGNKIAEGRKAHSLTQEELAKDLSVTRQTLSRWEGNLSKPDADSLGKMAKIFGVSVDYFFKEDNPKAPLTAPDFVLRDLKKDQKAVSITLLADGLFLLADLAYLGVSIGLGQRVNILISALLLPIFSLYLIPLILGWKLGRENLHLAESGDYDRYIAWNLRKLKHASKSGIERHESLLAAAYSDLDRLKEGREALSHVKNPILLDRLSPCRILFLLDEGNSAEAKGLYLSYARRHREGKSESERHTVVALDGLFHALEGKPVSPDEQKDMDLLLTSATFKKILALGPRPKEKEEGVASEALSQENDACLAPSFEAFDSLTGSGERRYQPWLSFIAALIVIVFAACFLIAALTVSPQSERPLRHMWVMAFSAAFSLFAIVFASLIRKKEPKDRTLPCLILGAIFLTLSLILSLTALA